MGSLCSAIMSLGPQGRNLLTTQAGRELAAKLGVSAAGILGLASTGTLDQLCATMPGAAPLAAALESLCDGAANTPRAGTYENCRIIVNADGTTRVICPEQTPSGDCGCGRNPPKPCDPSTSGNANCLASDPTFAPCTVESICNAYRFAPFTASWNGAPVALGPTGEPTLLVQRVTTTRYYVTVLSIGVASRRCLDSISVLSGPLATQVAVPAAALGYTCSRLRRNPDGIWVWAWDTPQWIYAPKLTVTDGRCQCPPGAMCCCQVFNGPTRFIVDLVKAPLDTDTTTFTVSYILDDCGKAQCGPCPPADLCGATLLLASYTNSASVQIDAHSYLWGAKLPPQEPILRYT